MAGISWISILCIWILHIPRSDQVQELMKKPELYSLHINSDIKYRFATTLVTSRVKNTDAESREAIFDVTLPNEAFITNLTLDIDGKIIVGDIKEKEEARQQYEAAQQRGESAGYIGTKSRETNRFDLKITVAAQSKVTFNLTYQELLKRKHGHYEQVIYIDPGQPVPDLDITVAILESREITDLKVPPLRNDIDSDLADLSTITVISQPTPKKAHVRFEPTIDYQSAQSESGMAGQFVVQYDVERGMDAGDVLLVNGYFVHFFAPEGFQPIPNDVLFILDTSGSMSGTKIKQLQDAMISIIDQLSEGDRMNIMTFSGSNSFWKTEMVDAIDEDMKEDAKSHVRGLRAGGWTDINSALTTGITFLRDRPHSEGAIRSPVAVFLTDGEATHGVTNRDQIMENVKKINEEFIPIFSLAFGQHADYDLVKKISIQNNGFAKKIYEASDAALQIAGFYNEIAVTLLNNLTFSYLDAPVKNLTQHNYANYFLGSEMVISGRVQEFDEKELNLKIVSNSVKGPNYVLVGDFSNNVIDLSLVDNLTDTFDFEKITEKVWAYLTIKQLLDKEFVAENKDEKDAYNNQVLELSLKYGFVTPLTSMVVTLPDSNEVKKPSITNEADPAAEKGKMQHSPMYARTGGAFLSPNSFGPMNSPVYYAAPLPPSRSRAKRPPAVLHDPVSPISDLMYSPTMSKFGAADFEDPLSTSGTHSRVKGRKDSKRRKNRKNKKGQNKRKTKRGFFQFPLRVDFQGMNDPLCFNLFENELESGRKLYSLYHDKASDLDIKIQLEKTKLGKWTKQGGVREIRLTNGTKEDVITSVSVVSKQTVKLQPFDLVVTKDDDGFLHILVERTNHHGPLTENGILGELLSKKIKIKTLKPKTSSKGKKNKRRKVMALLKIVGTKGKFPVMQRKIGPSVSETCWDARQREEKVIQMKKFRV